MTERKRLLKFVNSFMENATNELLYGGDFDDFFTDYLLDNGVIVPPCKTVWYIVNRNTEFECVMSANIEDLPLHIVKNLDKYEYYECKEEAEKVLKARLNNADNS